MGGASPVPPRVLSLTMVKNTHWYVVCITPAPVVKTQSDDITLTSNSQTAKQRRWAHQAQQSR
eukprot:2270774-Pyramimonas_sp.AAC.1